MWLCAFAVDMPLFKALLNHSQVAVAVAGPQARDRRCRGYQSWAHSGSSHAGEVPLSPVLSMAVYTKATGQANSALDNNTWQKLTSCLPHTVFLLFHVLPIVSFAHHSVAGNMLQHLPDLPKQSKEKGREISLIPLTQAGAHKRSSSLQPIN